MTSDPTAGVWIGDALLGLAALIVGSFVFAFVLVALHWLFCGEGRGLLALLVVVAVICAAPFMLHDLGAFLKGHHP